MGQLKAAQKKWLSDLGVLLGSEPRLNSTGDDDGPSGKTQPVEVLQDRRREFQRARAQWVSVKRRAEEDLEKVKDGARMSYLDDLEQFPKVEAGCKAIDEILDNLDDALRDTLDGYARTPLRDRKRLAELAASAAGILDRYQQFVAGNALMRAIDEREFADVTVHAPVMRALGALRSSLR